VSRRFFVLAVVVALFASACGKGDDGKPTKGNPKVGGKLTVPAATPSSLDPSQGSKREDLYILKQICDTLVAFDPVTGALEPGTAESWTLSPDAKVVTFKLRPGVKFHNGREVNSQDYVYSLSRFIKQDSGSKSYFILDKVVGYREVLDGRADTLAGAKAIDPLTLEIDLIEPYAEFPAVMAHPAAGAAIPKEEVDKDPAAFALMPVCTGPYKLDQPWNVGLDIDLVRFPDYYKANKAYTRDGQGYADEILVRTLPDVGEDIPDVATGYSWLVDGKVDLAEVPLTRLSGARRLRQHTLVEAPTGSFEYLGFPTKKLPLDNTDFRRGLGLAIDRSDVVDDLLEGTRVIPGGFLPPAAGVASQRSGCSAIKPKADAKAAQAAVAQSGISGQGTRLTVYYNDAGSGHERWLSRVTKSWESILEVRSTLKGMARDPYFKFLSDPGADGPFRSSWPVSFPSAEAVYGPLLVANSGDNFTKYESPEFDAALKAARATAGDKERADAYAKVGEILCRDLPLTPMWFEESHISVSDRVEAATTTPLDIYGDPILREIGGAR
jgi:ABC-type transport system substrate-binding protein